MRVKREPAHDQYVKPDAEHSLFRRFLHLLRPDRAVLRPDGHGYPFPLAGLGFGELARCVQPRARKRLQPVKGDAEFLVRALHPGPLQVLDYHRLELT